MRINKIKLFIIAVSTFSTVAYGQKEKRILRKGDIEYKDFSYIQTTRLLIDIAEAGYESKDLYQKLGDAYYFTRNMPEAARWYGELLNKFKDVNSEYYFRYALALKSKEDYENSDKWMQKFKAINPYDSRSRAFEGKKDYLEAIEGSSNDDLILNNMDINSEYSDFGGLTHKGIFFFASSRRQSGKNYDWNDQPFLEIFTADKVNNSYTNVKEVKGDVNSKYHESTPTFTPDGKYMFFTRNSYDKRVRKNKEGVSVLQIFRASLQDDGVWGDIYPVHFNSLAYSVTHPYINKAGTYLYFSSDMEGGYGSSDIYRVPILKEGELGEPENLGSSINSRGEEVFPFVNENGDLYYSSTGFPGLGGLDVFKCKKYEEKREKGVQKINISNMARPINSPYDDFAYSEDFSSKEGFVSSNREGGKGDDDIYRFKAEACKGMVKGSIRDKKTHQVISGAEVTLKDANGKRIGTLKANTEGHFEISVLECEKEYIISGNGEGYIGAEERFATASFSKIEEVVLYLERDRIRVDLGTDLALITNTTVYFDLGKHNIREDAKLELEKIVSIMNQLPDIKIDVRSHTDSRARDAYNLILSNNRAKSTIDYLVRRGIDRKRLSGRGYGETKLINHCSNGVKCSDKEHEINRRSEFIVVE